MKNFCFLLLFFFYLKKFWVGIRYLFEIMLENKGFFKIVLVFVFIMIFFLF